ncbi:fimbrillin family protein [Bacteroides sp. 214]|uniref:fimbrillin family protein n=1 Tax=Bacteroides sp. 214 TaxID=2302935 RepID=UPI0013D66500|nr:fimbrillin family protein [Bacteroides sp. 214]
MLFIHACSDEQVQDASLPGGELNLTSVISTHPTGRMTGTHFESNDKIGLFLTPGDAYNVGYVYNSNKWSPITNNPACWPGKNKTDIYAYYPYDASLTDARSHLFSINSNQEAVAGYTASDFLWAKVAETEPVETVRLSFQHRMSKIVAIVMSEEEGFWEDEIDVYLSGMSLDARIDLEDGTVSVAPNTVVSDVSMQLQGSLLEEEFSKQAFQAIVVPQLLAPGDIFLTIHHKGINYAYKMEEYIRLESGFTYTFHILIRSNALYVTVNSVNEWSDGGTYGGELMRLPKILDISSLDWTQSNVYHIYEGDSLIGMAAKEYLFSRTISNLDFPAIVVYPVAENSKIDLTKGFIAQVLNRKMNASFDFDINSGAVHGGSVEFNTEKNEIAKFVAGSLPVNHKVEFLSSGEVLGANDLYKAWLEARPYQLNDVDENSYPIVKIAAQYWTRENLKTEHYRDGSSVETYYYNNERDTYRDVFGGLYTWDAMMDERGIAPEGWHVPTEPEWWALRDYLYPYPSYKLKKRELWSTFGDTDNVTGFSALPGGRRLSTGTFNEIYYWGQWWSSAIRTTLDGWRVYFGTDGVIGNSNLNKKYAESIRLIRDI